MSGSERVILLASDIPLVEPPGVEGLPATPDSRHALWPQTPRLLCSSCDQMGEAVAETQEENISVSQDKWG